MLDLIITIDNYVPADTYTVQVYRHTSAIPMDGVIVNLAPNDGAIVIIRGLPDDAYDVEIIHNCAAGKSSTTRRPVYIGSTKSCGCPTGFTSNSDNTKCVRITTVAPTISTDGVITVGESLHDASYCRYGIRVYAQGFNSDGTGSSVWESGAQNAYWASLETETHGRLNIAGVWNANDAVNPLNQWIGFSQKINVAAAKVYYIAMAGDNYIRFKVNGSILVNQQLSAAPTTNPNFNWWHCYPVYLNAGENIIEMEGLNNQSIGSFAAEIYNCDLQALQNVTIATEAILNRIFSTLGGSTFNNKYSCPDGYALDTSGSPICKKIEYAACN